MMNFMYVFGGLTPPKTHAQCADENCQGTHLEHESISSDKTLTQRLSQCQECSKQPNFNFEGERPLYCADHKKEGMVDVNNKRCLECLKGPSFNFKDKPAQYCADHKKEGMVDVIHKRCLECNVRPSFNFSGEFAVYCAIHKKEGMIDVVSKHCLECTKGPSYNFEGKSALYCADHKKEGMIDIRSKRCIECTKGPTFNFKGTPPLYCVDHKKEGMVDVKHKQCLECNVRPNFGIEGKQPLYCFNHKKEGMINIMGKKCLECSKSPHYNFEGKRPIYCFKHKKDAMIDVVHTRCLGQGCYIFVTDKFEGYCLRCFVYNPANWNKPIYRNYKTKERDVVDRIKTLFPNVDWIADKRVIDGCSRKRPDLFLDMGSHIIIIEIDENKHGGYNCENRRIMEISQDVAHRPIVFIRFNPDAYTTEDGRKVTSCWRNNNLSIATVQKSKQDEWQHRINTLTQQIGHWMLHPTEKTIELVELFYS